MLSIFLCNIEIQTIPMRPSGKRHTGAAHRRSRAVEPKPRKSHKSRRSPRANRVSPKRVATKYRGDVQNRIVFYANVCPLDGSRCFKPTNGFELLWKNPALFDSRAHLQCKVTWENINGNKTTVIISHEDAMVILSSEHLNSRNLRLKDITVDREARAYFAGNAQGNEELTRDYNELKTNLKEYKMPIPQKYATRNTSKNTSKMWDDTTGSKNLLFILQNMHDDNVALTRELFFHNGSHTVSLPMSSAWEYGYDILDGSIEESEDASVSKVQRMDEKIQGLKTQITALQGQLSELEMVLE